jgi:hypothetical protein
MKRLAMSLAATTMILTTPRLMAAETFTCPATGGGSVMTCTTGTGPVCTAQDFSLEVQFPSASLTDCAHRSEWPATGQFHRSPVAPNGTSVRHTGCDFNPIGKLILTTAPVRKLRCMSTANHNGGPAHLTYAMEEDWCVVSVYWLGP